MSETTTTPRDGIDSRDARPGEEQPLVSVRGLTKHFTVESGLLGGIKLNLGDGFPLSYERTEVRAVEDVSFDIQRGETIGLVGESGCGKSTLARTLLRLLQPTAGDVYFKGENLAEMDRKELRNARKDMQMIFQDPQSSLDPRMKVGRIVEEPMRVHGMLDSAGREERARELLEKVGLDSYHYNRYPHAFSGGQRQRVNLARALAVNPDFIVCDEPVSALDVSIQAQVLNTMMDLQEEFDLTYLFIAHDLSVIRHISDRVAIMYLGQLVEVGERREVFENPQHPYTQSLLDSIPVPDPDVPRSKSQLQGDVPSPIDPPSGCRFRTRCPELIPPPGYGFQDAGEDWPAVRRFMRAVDRRSFEERDPEVVRAEFFDGSFPRGDAAGIVEEAIDLVSEEEFESASDLLLSNFAEESICSREKPDYEIDPVHGSGSHYVACHLHRE